MPLLPEMCACRSAEAGTQGRELGQRTGSPLPRGRTEFNRRIQAQSMSLLVLKRGATRFDRACIFLDLARHEPREIVRAASCMHRDAKPVGLEPLTYVLRVQRAGKRDIESANEARRRV